MTDAREFKVGLSLPYRTWPSGEIWPLARVVEYGVRAESLGFDSLWVGDHPFFEGFDFGWGADERIMGAHDPLMMFSHISAKTSTIEFGTFVLCARFRLPGQLAREARALAELSNDRFILGVGAGWHEPELEAWDIPTDHAYSRFKDYIGILKPLLAGERVNYEGKYLRVAGAEVPGTATPPLLIAASGPKMIKLAAAHGDAWVGGNWNQEMSEAFAEAEIAAGREPGSILRVASMNTLVSPDDETDAVLKQHPTVYNAPAVGVEAIAAAVEKHRAAGVDHLVIHLAPNPELSHHEDDIKLVAEALGLKPQT